MFKHLELLLKRGFWIIPLAWIFIINNIKTLFGDAYSPDSYEFYFLGKNIIAGNGYYSPVIRDFYLNPEGPLLSRSFPPLFPFLVGVTDFFLNQSMAAGRVINLFICIIAFYLWLIIAKRISYYLYVVPFLILITYSLIPPAPFWVDATAGRSSPLTWLLLLTTLTLLSDPSIFTDNKISIFVGIVLGLLTLTRFDVMIFCISLPAIIFIATKIPAKKIMFMYGALILVMLPWAIRNLIVFGGVLASDNAITAASTTPGIVQLQFFEHGVPLGINDPSLWFEQRFAYLKNNIWFFYSWLTPLDQSATAGSSNLLFKTIALLYLPGFIFSFISRKINYPLWVYFVISSTWCVLNLLCLSLTSYSNEARYFVLSWFVIVGGGALFIAVIIQKIISLIFSNTGLQKTKKASITTVGIELVLCLILGFLTLHFCSKDIYYNKHDDTWPQWAKLIKNEPVKKGELVATYSPEILSFYTGWKTIYLPIYYSGIEDGFAPIAPRFDNNYKAWLKRWKPSFLIIETSAISFSLAAYPHASVSTVLGPLVLLKINLDETVLTEQDESEDAQKRRLLQWGINP